MIGALRAFYWEIKMDVRGTLRYRFGLITDIVIFSVLLGIFLISDSGHSFSETYHYTNYKELLVLGYMAWIYAVTAISSISQIVSGELRLGTFYKKYNSKYPLQLLLLARMIASLLIETIVIFVLLILAGCLWKVNMTFHPMIIPAILGSTIGMYGIGLMIAGLAIFYKRTGSIVFLIQMGLLFVTDTVPAANRMLSFSKILPLTSCNLVIKYILSGESYRNEFLFLLVTMIIFFGIGVLVFNFFLSKARKKGNLLFY